MKPSQVFSAKRSQTWRGSLGGLQQQCPLDYGRLFEKAQEVIASTPEIRWEKVERIRAGLKDNHYLADASRLARNLLNELFGGCGHGDYGAKILPFRRKAAPV